MRNDSILFILLMLLLQSVALCQNSFYTDVKAHEVGDVVTILVMETANASRESKANSSASSTMNAGGTFTGNLTNFIPLFNLNGNASKDLQNGDDTFQRETVSGKITVTIIEKLDSDLLRIEGSRKIEVNGETNYMSVSGTVRAKDIMADNTIYSYLIADAKIQYKKAGLANKIGKTGKIIRWSTVLIGIAVTGIAFAGGLGV